MQLFQCLPLVLHQSRPCLELTQKYDPYDRQGDITLTLTPSHIPPVASTAKAFGGLEATGTLFRNTACLKCMACGRLYIWV